MTLNQEEQDFLDSYENDEWSSVGTPERLAQLQSYAKATLNQNKEVTLLLSSVDFEVLQARAIEKGVSHQAFISSILHKYVTGQFVETSQ